MGILFPLELNVDLLVTMRGEQSAELALGIGLGFALVLVAAAHHFSLCLAD